MTRLTCHLCRGSRHPSLYDTRLIARFDSRYFRGSVGSAEELQIHPASGKQIVNAALEVT